MPNLPITHIKSKPTTPRPEPPKGQGIKFHGIVVGMPDKIPTVEDLAFLRGFEPKD